MYLFLYSLEPRASPAPQVPQVEETVKFDESGFIMEDIYEDVSQPPDAPPEAPPPAKEPTKTDVSAPSLPPRNPNLKPTPTLPSAPSLPPRNQPTIVPPAEPEEGIMEEFYEDMDEVQAQYQNAKIIMDNKTKTAAVEEPPAAKKELPLPKADAEKKSPLLKKKELKKEKEQQKKEAKKREKENKKLKKEKEKSKTLTQKPRSKSTELKAEDVTARPRAFTSPSPKPEEDEEYVIEELHEEKPSVDEPEPIDEEIYEDVDEPPLSPKTTTPTSSSSSIKKPTPPPTSVSVSTNKSPAARSGVLSPLGNVSNFKRDTSPVTEPPRSQSASPGSNVQIRKPGITISTISKSKPPTSVTPITTTSSTKTTDSETTTTTTASTTSSTKTTSVTTKVASSASNRPRVKVSDAIYKFQKRSSTIDAVLHKGTLFHKAPGRMKFRQEYCEITGTVMNFYREKGDEKAFTTLNLEECELQLVKEQYEGRRYVFCLAAGSASDMLSPELQADLQKWLEVLEPLVKKYVKDN